MGFLPVNVEGAISPEDAGVDVDAVEVSVRKSANLRCSVQDRLPVVSPLMVPPGDPTAVAVTT
jgi:hypothetical protein